MNDVQHNGHSDGADPAITALLRETYKSPAGSGYWSGLEQRVMARIQEAQPLAWWAVFSEWRTAGLVAATLALLLSGAAMVRQRGGERASMATSGAVADSTYEAALQRVLEGDAVTFTSNPRRRLPEDAPERYLNPIPW